MSAMPARKLDKQPQAAPEAQPQKPSVADRDWHPAVGVEFDERPAATPRLRTGRQYEADTARRESADREWHPRVEESHTPVSPADSSWHPEVGARYSDPAARRSVETRSAVERKRAIAEYADIAWHPAVADVELPEVARHEGWRPVSAPAVDGPIHTTAPRTPESASAVAALADLAWHPGAVIEADNGPAVVESARAVGDRRGGSWHPEVGAVATDERSAAPKVTEAVRERRRAITKLADCAWHPAVD